MFNFIKQFLTDRSIQARIGGTYSNTRTLDMGLPQGPVIVPIFLNTQIADLPKMLSKDSVLVQYADDICL